MTLEILRNFIQSSNLNILYGSGISRPYLSTLGNIEKWLTKLAEDSGYYREYGDCISHTAGMLWGDRRICCDA